MTIPPDVQAALAECVYGPPLRGPAINYARCPAVADDTEYYPHRNDNSCIHCGARAAVCVADVEKTGRCPWDGVRREWWDIYRCNACGGYMVAEDFV